MWAATCAWSGRVVDLHQEQRERTARDAPPPVLAPDPVTDERVSGLLPAQHVPHDLAVQQDRPFPPGVVAQDVRRPVLHERFSVPRRERRHLVRDRVALDTRRRSEGLPHERRGAERRASATHHPLDRPSTQATREAAPRDQHTVGIGTVAGAGYGREPSGGSSREAVEGRARDRRRRPGDRCAHGLRTRVAAGSVVDARELGRRVVGLLVRRRLVHELGRRWRYGRAPHWSAARCSASPGGGRTHAPPPERGSLSVCSAASSLLKASTT